VFFLSEYIFLSLNFPYLTTTPKVEDSKTNTRSNRERGTGIT